jgi:hypothetical protein
VVDASIEGPSLLIAFNVRFLREVLDVIKTPNVALETTPIPALGSSARPATRFLACDHAHAPGQLRFEPR